MKYRKGDILEFKGPRNWRTWQIVTLIVTAYGEKYGLRVLTSSDPTEIGEEKDIHAKLIDNNQYTSIISGVSVPSPEHSLSEEFIGHNFGERGIEKFAVKMTMQYKCHCDRFQVVHYGCKCGGI